MTRFPISARAALLTIAGVGALAVAPRAARAQLPGGNPFSYGAFGGLAVPTGQLSDGLNAGYSVGGFVDLRPAPGPVSFRIEGGYDRFSTKDSQTYATVNGTDYGVQGNTHFIRGNVNAIVRLPTSGAFRPYITGGVGIYGIGGGYSYTGDYGTVSTSDRTLTKFGINGGVGVDYQLTGISVFLEARAHGVQTDATPVTYIPITVGIRF